MDEAAFEAQRGRVMVAFNRWIAVLDLGTEWRFHSYFLRERHSDEEHTYADTGTDSTYLYAQFRWYLPAIADLEDWELDEVILHELMHVLTEDVVRFLKDKPEAHIARERVVQRLARQFVAAYSKGGEMCHRDSTIDVSRTDGAPAWRDSCVHYGTGASDGEQTGGRGIASASPAGIGE